MRARHAGHAVRQIRDRSGAGAASREQLRQRRQRTGAARLCLAGQAVDLALDLALQVVERLREDLARQVVGRVHRRVRTRTSDAVAPLEAVADAAAGHPPEIVDDAVGALEDLGLAIRAVTVDVVVDDRRVEIGAEERRDDVAGCRARGRVDRRRADVREIRGVQARAVFEVVVHRALQLLGDLVAGVVGQARLRGQRVARIAEAVGLAASGIAHAVPVRLALLFRDVRRRLGEIVEAALLIGRLRRSERRPR